MTMETMADRAGHGKRRAAAVAAALLALAGVLVVLGGLTLLASLAGLAAAAPPPLLLSPVLAPAALLAWLLAAGAASSAALALGALSILSRLARRMAAATTSPSDGEGDGGAVGDRDCIDRGKRRVGELTEVAGQRTPHAALAVVSSEQGLTDHKKAKHYQHFVAGRMVEDDA